MRPLKREVDAVAALLEQGGDSPQRLADAVIRAVDAVRGERTTWTVVLRFGRAETAIHHGYGPFSTKSQAEKSAEKNPAFAEATGFALVPFTNEAGLAQALTNADVIATPTGDWSEVALDRQAFKAGWDGVAATRGQYLKAGA